MRISPASAFAAMREARISVAPNRSPSSSIGVPALSPTREWSGSGIDSVCAAKARRRAIAQSIALVTGPKGAMKPSPILHVGAAVPPQRLPGDAFVLAQQPTACLARRGRR